jgi:hypothetical protein
MSDYNKWNTAARGGYAGQTAAVDAGLRAYMLRVYNYMAAAVALTGVVGGGIIEKTALEQKHRPGKPIIN